MKMTIHDLRGRLNYLQDKVDSEEQGVHWSILKGLVDNLEDLINAKNIKPRPKSKQRMQVCQKSP